MAVRMTGMISGLDTESLIKGMVDAQKLKNKKVGDKQTLLTWKKDKWKELNTKLYKLYTEDLYKMKMQGSYQTKAATTSNESLVSVVSGTNAPEGAHNITIDTLASSQYVTSGKLAPTVTTSTTLKETLGMTSSANTDLVIQLENGDLKRNLVVSDTTTLGDFVNAAKEIGLNASYDTTQQRLFISAKSSGVAGKFSITTGEMSTTGAAALKNIQTLVNYTGVNSTNRNDIDAAIKTLEGNTITDSLYSAVMSVYPDKPATSTDPNEQKIIDALTTLRDFAMNKVKADTQSAAVQKVKSDIKLSLQSDPANASLTDKELNALVEKEYSSTNLAFNTDGTPMLDAKGNQITKAAMYQNNVKAEYDTNITTNTTNTLSLTGGLVSSIKDYLPNYAISTGVTGNLTKIGLDEITGVAVPTTTTDKLTVIAASDAKITLDGAELTGSSNVIKANGLTITAKGLTTSGAVSINVTSNTQATYDMVKNFVKSYNEILKEMNDQYYAPSTRSYAPLSDDEKTSMTDDQIDKWETKIQDSILRRDSSLGSLIDGMRTSLNQSITVGTAKYSLSSFGIQTSNDYTEKGLLHIAGNKDDATFSTKEDKLMKALEEDPDTVMNALSGIAQNLYDTMNDKMKAIPNVRSAFTFYNDKTMTNQQTDYAKQIASLEDKLTAMEDKYYKQFAAMETAMAKLQSQTNALTGMMGTSK